MTNNDVHTTCYEAAQTLLEMVAGELHPSVHHIFFNEVYRTVKEAIESVRRVARPSLEPGVN